MSVHVLVPGNYFLVLMALGLWIGGRMRAASDFLVAERHLGPGTTLSTMLAASFHVGSTASCERPWKPWGESRAQIGIPA